MNDQAAFCRHLAEQAPPGPLLLALSGGLDSSLLLHLLVQAGLAPRLAVVHVDHQLQEQSGDWARFCQRQVEEYGVPFALAQVCVDPAEGLEAGARDARYGALLPMASARQATLVTAHHRDDQAETLLFRLLRGAGVQGLSAMRERSGREGVPLWRPLLAIGRPTLESWAEESGIQWQEDPSNGDQHHRRNYLRHRIVPALRERWPGADATLSRTAEHMAEAAELLEEVAKADAVEAGVQGAVFPLEGLAALTTARQRNLLRWWLVGLGAGAPSAAVLEQIRLLQAALEDSQGKVEWGDNALRLYRGALYFGHRSHFAPWQGEAVWHEGALPPDIPNWQWSKEQSHHAIAVLRPPGDLTVQPLLGAMTLRRNGMHQLIKELWRAAGVPPWQRRQWPLLCGDGAVLSVPGCGLADGLSVEQAQQWFLTPATP